MNNGLRLMAKYLIMSINSLKKGVIYKVALALILLTSINSCNNIEYKTVDGFTQGTTYHVVYSADVPFELDTLTEKILFQIDNSLSVYNKSSLITRINNGEQIEADTLFTNVFNRSREIYDISEGLFDVSAAPLFNIWGFGFKNRERVTPQVLDSALALTGMDKIWMENGFVVRSVPGVTLNFNAIAQGYTADVIAFEYDKLGIKNYMIEVGGEIVCKGMNPKGKSWSVGIDKPESGNMIQGAELQDVLLLSSGGLATSGNYRKFYEENGERYSHTINPKTGYPVKHNLLSATVIAQDAMTADAYATWFMVVGLERAREIIESSEGIEGYLIYSQDGEFKVYKSPGVRVRNRE